VPIIEKWMFHNISFICKLIYFSVTHGSSVEIIEQYSSVLLEQLHAASIADTMVAHGLLTETDREVISTAANEHQKNYYILERVQNMDNHQLLLFCDVLQGVGNQRHIGGTLMNSQYTNTVSGKVGHDRQAICLTKHGTIR